MQYCQFLNSTDLGQVRLRHTIFDVAATMLQGDSVSEVLMYKDVHFHKRGLYYPMARLVNRYPATNPKETNPYSLLRPVYAIYILGFNMYEDKDAFRLFKIYDEKHKVEYPGELFRIAAFELKKVSFDTTNQKHWHDFFMVRPLASDAPGYIKDAAKLMQRTNMTKEEIDVIAEIDKRMWIVHGQIENARLEGKQEEHNKLRRLLTREKKRDKLRQLLDQENIDIKAILAMLDDKGEN